MWGCSNVMDEKEPLPAENLQSGDTYFEDGLMVFTAQYLLRRGYCCNNGCRHCPYKD